MVEQASLLNICTPSLSFKGKPSGKARKGKEGQRHTDHGKRGRTVWVTEPARRQRMMMCLPGIRGQQSVLPQTDDVSCMVRFATAHVDRMGACSGSIMEVSPPYAPCVVVGRTRDPREDKTHVVDVCTTWDITGNEDSVISLHRDCVRE